MVKNDQNGQKWSKMIKMVKNGQTWQQKRRIKIVKNYQK